MPEDYRATVKEGKLLKPGVKRVLWAIIFFAVVFGVLQTWMFLSDRSPSYMPNYPQLPLNSTINKQRLSPEDYELILMQTGLGKSNVDYLRAYGEPGEFEQAQERFFASSNIYCQKNTPISAEESLRNDRGEPVNGLKLVNLQAGDILISASCHTFGWRNGHAAIVVDPKQGITLESVVLGKDSCLQSVEKWERYPTVMVFKLKGASPQKQKAVAAAALKRLNGIPYGLTVGLLSEKFTGEPLKATHCAHLVYSAYKSFGWDLDANGGPIVTPQDLAMSPQLELKQVYGMDPKKLWA